MIRVRGMAEAMPFQNKADEDTPRRISIATKRYAYPSRAVESNHGPYIGSALGPASGFAPRFA